jgi:hypothetical protein
VDVPGANKQEKANRCGPGTNMLHDALNSTPLEGRSHEISLYNALFSLLFDFIWIAAKSGNEPGERYY